MNKPGLFHPTFNKTNKEQKVMLIFNFTDKYQFLTDKNDLLKVNKFTEEQK